jgi:hypothetical protein
LADSGTIDHQYALNIDSFEEDLRRKEAFEAAADDILGYEIT